MPYVTENFCTKLVHGNIPVRLYTDKKQQIIIYMYISIITVMDFILKKAILFYYTRSMMENSIKESKNGFDFAVVGTSSKIVDANRFQIHIMAYNVFIWFKRWYYLQKCENNKLTPSVLNC